MRTSYGARIASLLLALVMVFEIMPASALAAEREQWADPPAETAQTVEPDAPTQTAQTPTDASGEEPFRVVAEVEELRGEREKHFRLSDGSFVAVDYGTPVHYEDADGTWQEIDNTLQAAAAPALLSTGDETAEAAAVYTTENGDSVRQFAATLRPDAPLVTLSDGAWGVEMSLLQAETVAELTGGQTNAPAAFALTPEETMAQTAAELDDTAAPNAAEQQAQPVAEQLQPEHLRSALTYPDVLPGVDLRYDNCGFDVKESIIINECQSQYRYRFLLRLNGLTARLQEDGSVALVHGDELVYLIPAPYMQDAAGAQSTAAEYTLRETEDGYILTVTADAAWINDSARTLPVAIDPTLYRQGSSTRVDIANSYIRSGSPNTTSATYAFTYCGNDTATGTSGQMQAYYYVSDLPKLPENSRIVNASLSLYHAGFHGSQAMIVRAFELSGTPASGTSGSDWIKSFTWNNHSAQSSTMLDAVNLTSGSLYEWVNWDITTAAAKWYADAGTNKGITLAANDAANLSSYASFGGYAHSANPPVFFVVYRNRVGIEPYYTYQTQSAGNAGSAYVADNSLQLTLLRTDLSVGSTVNPFALTHVYNSAYGGSQFTNGNMGIQSKDYSKMIIGAGWKLNVQETVRACTLADTAETYYVYTDSDGTEHYFYYDSSKGALRDEDGLGLTLTQSGTTFTIADEYQNKRIFYNGYLSVIQDSNGNAIYIAYNESSSHTLASFSPTATDWRPLASGNQITSIYRKNDGQSTEWLASFTWSSNRLASVTDKIKGQTTTFTYTTASGVVYLTGISYPNGTANQVSYGYDTAGAKRLTSAYDNEAGQGLEYTYRSNGSGWDVKRIAQYYQNGTARVYGATMRAWQTGLYTTEFRYYGDDRITEDDPVGSGTAASQDDLLSTCFFDATGRTVNYVGQNPEKQVISGGVTSFTQNSGTASTNNRVLAQAGEGMGHINLLKDGSLECSGVGGVDDTMATPWEKTTSNPSMGLSFYQSAAIAHSGTIYGELNIAATATATTANEIGICQAVTLTEGQTYNMSAYLKIETGSTDIWDYGGVYVYFADSDGNRLQKSDAVAAGTGTVQNGWMRVYVAFTPQTTGTYRVGVSMDNVKGSAKYDDLQLQLGDAPGEFNLLEDAGFEYYKSWKGSSAWVPVSATVPSPPDAFEGTFCAQLKGNTGTDKRIYQDIVVNASGTTTYLLSGWGKNTSLPFAQKDSYTSTERYFGLQAVIYYTDGTTETSYIPFNCYTQKWQYACGAVVAKKPEKTIQKIRVIADLNRNAGTALFDNIILTKEPVQTYSYDKDGKLSAANASGDQQTYTYDGADLKQFVSSSGTYSFTYDAAHNLKTAVNDGVTMTLGYDAAGNTTSSKLTNNKDGSFLQSSAQYSNNANMLAKTTDVNGVSVSYGYNSKLLLNQTTAANGTVVHNTYQANNNRLTSSYITDVVSLTYTYTGGRVTDISRKSFRSGTATWQHLVFTFDPWGNLTQLSIAKANAAGAISDNPAGAVTRVLTTKTYESGNGKLHSEKQANGSGKEYVYDRYDRLIETRHYSGYGTTSQTLLRTDYCVYDGRGVLAEAGSKDEDGIVTEKYTYEYDSLGRLIRSAEFRGSACKLMQRLEYLYDTSNRLTAQNWLLGGRNFSEKYVYSSANGTLTKMTTGTGRDITYGYDNLLRQQTATLTGLYQQKNIYTTGAAPSQTTNQIRYYNYYKTDGTTVKLSYRYTYDTAGNISKVESKPNATAAFVENWNYSYDAQGQLTEARAVEDDLVYSYTYDTAGNILNTDKVGLYHSDEDESHTYAYTNNAWVDLLTAYDGKGIAYEGQTYNSLLNTVSGTAKSGNPVSYYNGTRWDMTWENGRQLSKAASNKSTVTYSYDGNGIRTQKKVQYLGGKQSLSVVPLPDRSITYNYVYASGKLMQQTWGNNTLDFFYDAAGRPLGFWYFANGATTHEAYYYFTNQQGDITRIEDVNGNIVAEYSYDPYGKLLSSSGTMASINPLRYRGYYYDTETGFYYVSSRYYDPEVGRFINADGYVSTGQGILGNNMFAYCGNNPVNRVDPTGHFWSEIWEFAKTAVTEIGKAIGVLSPAYAGCGGAAVADGPLPIGDIIGAAGAALLTVGAIGYGIYQATQAPSISIPKAEEKEKDITVPPPSPTVIYRYGGTNPGNLTPKAKDKYTGLSFSTVPKPGAAVTTIEALNATGLVYAVRDGATHVSVRPVGGTMDDWISAGSSSVWTQAVKSVVIKWDGVN